MWAAIPSRRASACLTYPSTSGLGTTRWTGSNRLERSAPRFSASAPQSASVRFE